MPWKVTPVSEIRLALVHQVLSLNVPVAQAARQFDVSRKTAYKWLRRYREQPELPLDDHSRRPQQSPARTGDNVQQHILDVRDRFGWGARKIHAYLRDNQPDLPLPSVRTVNNILRREGRITPKTNEPAPSPQFFERTEPHQLWQCDHKGPLEVQRRKIHPFTILDDHSRYLIDCRVCDDLTMARAFDVLWNAFGEWGMPEAILCDNAFSTRFQVPRTISWIEARLIRLGIRPLHGRPYHPQTQGKVERLHGTLEREVWPHVRKDSIEHFQADLDRWRNDVYNPLRPHEAIGDVPPLARFRPSQRPRPDKIPDVEYPADATLRKVHSSGDVKWKNCRILAGRGLVGEHVRIEEREHDIALFYANHEIRTLSLNQLLPGKML